MRASQAIRQKSREINQLLDENSRLAQQVKERDDDCEELAEQLEKMKAEKAEKDSELDESAKLVNSLERQVGPLPTYTAARTRARANGVGGGTTGGVGWAAARVRGLGARGCARRPWWLAAASMRPSSTPHPSATPSGPLPPPPSPSPSLLASPSPFPTLSPRSPARGR